MACKLIAFLAAALLCSCAGDSGQPSSLTARLDQTGQRSDGALRWRKLAGPDFDVYHGSARPPLSGEAGIYEGTAPSFHPEPGSTLYRGRLGDYKVTWYRKVRADGSVYQTTIFNSAGVAKLHVWLSVPRAQDLAPLAAELAKSPTFARPGSHPPP